MTPDEFYSQVKKHYNNQLPFVAYRKPNAYFIKSFLQTSDNLHSISDFSENGFIFAPFDSSETIILFPSVETKSLQCDFLSSNDIDTSHLNITGSDEEKKSHIQLLEKSLQAIKNNKFQKVVISRIENIELKATDPIEIFKKLLNKYVSAFVYVWYHPKVGLWLGATPETLLEIEGNRLTTMALAGTQKFEGNYEVAWQKKEMEEQQFVTDFIVSSLQSSDVSLQSSVNIVKISNPETIRAGNLLHLKTTITAHLKPDPDNHRDLNLKQLLQALHPTPAVCGLPKEESKEFILKHENYDREFYTGFLGELNLKERKSRNSKKRNVENDAYATLKNVSNLYVNLRCIQLKQNQAIIYVGGGITKDSIPEKEWEETVSKSEVIKSIL